MKKHHDPFVIPKQAKEMRDGSLSNFSKTRQEGDTFITEEPSPLWLGSITSSAKLNFFFIVLLILFFVLFIRLSYLQIIKGEVYHRLAEGNRLRLEYLPAKRGIIFDRWHTPLVENVAAFSFYFNPHGLPKAGAERHQIRELLLSLSVGGEPLATSTVDELMKSDSQVPLLIKENLDYQEALKLIILTERLNCLKIVIDPYRHYLGSDANAHLLGYTNRITSEEKEYYLAKGYQLIERVGRIGIEGFYEEELRGKPGKRQIEVDSLGRKQQVIAEVATQLGQNLVLAIDNGLQEAIAGALKKYLYRQAAAVVALDPRSGKVRALISWPTFNHNAFSQNLSPREYDDVITNPLKPLFNRAISGEYPSGSIIKLLVAAAALEENLINRSTQIYSKGGIWYDKWFFSDWKEGGHGLTNIIKALAESVNTYFYYLALEEFDGHQGLGLETMLNYFRDFGLSKVLGIDLEGEGPGFLPTPKWKEEIKGEIWYPGDTLHLAIGQGDILVTPLQVAGFTAAVANGGTLFRPQLVEEIIDPLTGEAKRVTPETINHKKVNQDNLKIVTEGMRAAILWGSARSLAAQPLAIAGKTGTAQVGGSKKPHAWFTSFAPYQDPELVLTIVVEYGGESNEIAVPIAREIWQWYYNNRI